MQAQCHNALKETNRHMVIKLEIVICYTNVIQLYGYYALTISAKFLYTRPLRDKVTSDPSMETA